MVDTQTAPQTSLGRAPSPAGPRLQVRNLYKSFAQLRTAMNPTPRARVEVLRDVSFEVYNGEFVAVIGASGCGKTTLIRIIDGLIPYDSGEVLVDGKPVQAPGHDRGVVFQSSLLLPWRTAVENVEFGLEIKGIPKKERRERAMEMLDLVRLRDWAYHHPHQLSGGMQQRVGLARAFAIDPELLLMDEPFGALDAQTREVLQGELLRIYGQTGKTTVFVTHDLDEAVYLADRVIILKSRPGEIHEIVTVPIPRPRPELVELKGEREFYETRHHIWEAIRQAARADERQLREEGLL